MDELLENMGWSDRLRQERIRRNWRQQEVADQLGTTVLTIKRWERGRQRPSIYFRQKLCTLFEKSAEELGFALEDLRPASSIQAKTPTVEVFSSSSPNEGGLWGVPFLRNPFFTGREHVLQQLHAALHQEQTALLSQSSTLSGLGGIGKTQTAIEYAYRYAHDYTAIFWVNAQTAESLIARYMALAELLNLPERHEQEQRRIVAAVLRWLNSHSDWLLIFDNVEDTGLLKEFLPSSYRGSLLLTSRRQALGITAQALDLEQMTREEGMRLLLHRARLLEPTASLDQLSSQEQNAAREIAALMDGLPLALDQAGAYIEATQCRLTDYLQLFQASSLRLLDEREAHAEHPTPVSSTFLMAFAQLEQNHPAAEILTVCAFLAPEAIPEEFFQKGAAYLGSVLETLVADPLAFQGAIKALLSYSLLRRHPATRTLTIHRLVQVVLKEHLSATAQRSWAIRIIKMMTHLFPSDEYTQPDYWQLGERFLPHALVCLTSTEPLDDDITLPLPLMNHVAAYLSKCARYAEAEQLFERALSIGEQAVSPQLLLKAETLHGLADNYFAQGQFARAGSLFQQAIHLRKQELGTDHPLVALSLNRLGVLYWQQGNFEQAESLYKQAWHISEHTLGPEHSLVALPLNNLGILYWQQGKYDEAEPFYQRALHIWEQAMGPDHNQTAYTLNNLGLFYEIQGKYELAEPLYQRALYAWEHTLGPLHPQVAYPLHGLADVYQAQGKYAVAEPLYQRAISIWEQAFDPNHSLLAGPLNGLAHLYQAQGQYALAEPLYQRALAIRQHHLGANHPETAEILHALAGFRQAQQQTTEALSLYQQALTIREQALGPHHLKTRETRTAYIQLLQEPGLEALITHQELERTRQALAMYYLETVATYIEENNLVVLLDQLKCEYANLHASLQWTLEHPTSIIALRLENALLHFWERQQPLDKSKTFLKPDETCSLARSLYLPGLFAWTIGDFSLARSYAEQGLAKARDSREKVTLAYLIDLSGQIALDQGEDIKARTLLEEGLMLHQEAGDILGSLNSLFFLERTHSALGELTRARAYAQEHLALSKTLGYQPGIIGTLTFLARLALEEGNTATAYELFAESLALLHETHENLPLAVAINLQGFGLALATQRRLTEAVRLWGAAESLCALLPEERALITRAVTLARAELGEEMFIVAWTQGQAITLEQARATMEHIALSYQPPSQATSSASQTRQHHPSSHHLTDREVEVLRLVARGLTDAQVAEALVISPRTVNAHLRSIYAKLNIASRNAATYFALAHNLL